MLLLTGGAGFIGSHFLGAAPSSFKVRCLVRSASASRITPSPSVEIVPFDLLSEGPPDRWLEGVTCVVHLAALLRKQDPSLMERVNVDATRRLVAAAQGAGVKKFVFASTENVLREDLDDAYAATKRRAEEAVRGFANHLILRPSFVYGPGDTHGLSRLIEAALKSPVIPLFGGLKGPIQPLHVDDMAEYLWRGVQTGVRGTYLVAGGEALGLTDFLKRACAARGARRLFVPIPYPVCRLSAMLGGLWGPKAAWGPAQFRNIYGGRAYSIEETVRAFNYRPRPLAEGLSRWLASKP